MNHILAHLHSADDKIILRLVPVAHTKDYHLEYEQKYGNTATLKYACFYNAAKWYERLLEDFAYKKFKNIELLEVATGVWTVKYIIPKKTPFEIPANTLKNLLEQNKLGDLYKPEELEDDYTWFDTALTPYLKKRLADYNEDADDSNDIIAQLENSFADFKSIPIHKIFKEVYNEETNVRSYMLANPEKHYLLENQYVLTLNELYALVLCYEYQVYVPTEEKKYDSDVVITKTEDCFTINKTSFNERDIIKNLAVLGIDLERYNKIRNSNKYRDIKYQSLEDWEATGNSLYDTPLFPYEKEVGCELESFSENVLDVKQDKTRYHVYHNKILDTRSLCETPYEFLNEMSVVTGVELETEIAKNLIKPLFDSLNDKAFLSDFANLVTFVEAMTVRKAKAEKTDTQKFFTKQYVEKYKDDNAEMLASIALDKAYQYLFEKMDIGKESINRNRIGQDLVFLGVKKVRKRQGYFYGLRD